jgi:hypothetical protein
MTRTFAMSLAAAIFVTGLECATAQEAAPAGAGDGQQVDTRIEVLEIKGTADFRNEADAAWQPLKTDSPLSVGSEIRTGLRSLVKLKLGANSEVEVKSLTTIAIADLAVSEEDKTIRTRVGKKYGTMKAKVHKVGELSNDYRIDTPSSVLAIRGSGGEHGEFGGSWYVSWQEGNSFFTYHNETHQLLPSDLINHLASNPNTPPLHLFLLMGQNQEDQDQEGQDQKKIEKGMSSFHSNQQEAGNLGGNFDPGGED